MNYKHEVIFCIVNSGFTDAVMDAAREFGARGGTVISARGTANREAENIFGITIQPEKEVVMILASTDIKDAILHALYKAVGLNTPGQGIAFSVPVSATAGIGKRADLPKDPKPPKQEPAEEKGEEPQKD